MVHLSCDAKAIKTLLGFDISTKNSELLANHQTLRKGNRPINRNDWLLQLIWPSNVTCLIQPALSTWLIQPALSTWLIHPALSTWLIQPALSTWLIQPALAILSSTGTNYKVFLHSPVYRQLQCRLRSFQIRWGRILLGTGPWRRLWEDKFYRKLHRQQWLVSFWWLPWLRWVSLHKEKKEL